MRIAVFSDIHSNHRALGACLAHAEEQGIDGAVFLGDYVSDFACPQKTLELLYDFARRHACRFIRGNREEYMTAYRLGEITGWQDGSASGSLLYTYEGLREEDLDWISTLDNYGEEGFPGGPDLAYCHGAPWKTGGTLPEGGPDTQRRLKDIPGALLLCGHTHRMGMYFSGPGPKLVVRAGSVGYPLSTPGFAQMVFLENAEDGAPRWRARYALVPYDVKGAVEEMHACGLMERAPVWAAMCCHALLTGENIAGLLPPYAQALFEKDCGQKVSYAAIPEAYWQKAAAVYRCETHYGP